MKKLLNLFKSVKVEIKPHSEHKRQGQTGVWKFISKHENGNIVAESDWGSNYQFHPRFWEMLPVIA